MNDGRPGIHVGSLEPLYRQLKRILIEEIERRRREGDLLPSEPALCRRYSVSRTVVRQALGELEDDGLVHKVKGKGTYVTGRSLTPGFVQQSVGFHESLVRAGHTVRSKIIDLRTEPSGVALAKLVEVGLGEAVVRFDRVRSVDGRPVQVVRTVLPSRLFPGLEELDLTDRSLYQVLADSYGVRPATGQRAIGAMALSQEDARYLGAAEGEPALRVEGATRSAEGVLFEYSVAVSPGNRFRFDIGFASP
jgi:GntR family transcriptional regulator